MPNLRKIGNYFLFKNKSLVHLKLPNLRETGSSFLYCNNSLTHLELPNLTQTGDAFLNCNNSLTHLELPNLTIAGENFLSKNKSLTYLYLPKLPELREKFSGIIGKNTQRGLNRKGIVRLDQDVGLTTSEVKAAQGIITEFQKDQGKTQNEIEGCGNNEK